MKAILLIALLVGCDYELPPEKPTDVDCGVIVVDAGLPDAVSCWRIYYYHCHESIWQICVPYDGCSQQFLCPGDTGPVMQYCGPGWVGPP